MSVKKWIRTALLAMTVILIIAMFYNRSLTESGTEVPLSKRKALPNLAYRRIDGRLWRLSDHRGEVVFLNFWAPWCPPCREETPGLVRTYEKFRSEGLTVAGIDVDGDTSSLPPFIRQFGVPYAILLPSPGSPLMDQIESLPTSLLLDQEGGVARTYIGAISEDTLATAVAALLKERRSDLSRIPATAPC